MTASDPSESPIHPVRWPATVRRVTVGWNGQGWSVLGEVRVKSMTLPAPDELPDGAKSLGFWIECIDSQGRVRHREAMADPLAGMEQFDETGQVTRLTHPPHDVTLEILVPDLGGVTELHLVSNPPTTVLDHHGGSSPRRTVLRLSTRVGEPDDGHAPPTRDDHDH